MSVFAYFWVWSCGATTQSRPTTVHPLSVGARVPRGAPKRNRIPDRRSCTMAVRAALSRGRSTGRRLPRGPARRPARTAAATEPVFPGHLDARWRSPAHSDLGRHGRDAHPDQQRAGPSEDQQHRARPAGGTQCLRQRPAVTLLRHQGPCDGRHHQRRRGAHRETRPALPLADRIPGSAAGIRSGCC